MNMISCSEFAMNLAILKSNFPFFKIQNSVWHLATKMGLITAFSKAGRTRFTMRLRRLHYTDAMKCKTDQPLCNNLVLLSIVNWKVADEFCLSTSQFITRHYKDICLCFSQQSHGYGEHNTKRGFHLLFHVLVQSP